MTYKKINDGDIAYLNEAFGKENVQTGETIEDDFMHDELQTIEGRPDVHLYVNKTEDIQKIMAYAHENGIPVTVRGSGTGLVGGSVAVFGGILLDTSKMNQILELDKTNMTLSVEPGVLLMDIAEHVEKEGFFYAPDPGEKSATIGGNIATNAGGMRAVKYGVTRDWIRGLEVVLPDGTLIQLGGKVVKNSSGYALKDLIIGSEGTLGIITKAILKLIPLPEYSVSLLVPFDDREQAIAGVSDVIRAHTLPTAVEFLEKDILAYSEEFLGKAIPNRDYPAYLLLTYDGNTQTEIDKTIDAVSAFLVDELKAKDVYTVDTAERKKSVWDARGAFLEAIKATTPLMDECDVVLPRSEVSEFLDFIHAIGDELSIRIPYFGHVGDGNLHIYFCKDDLSDDVWDDRLKRGFDKIYDKAFSMGGLVSGEHGIGHAKKSYLHEQVGKRQVELMRGIKHAFDPNHILNPGKIV